jgi:hypothetical protein
VDIHIIQTIDSVCEIRAGYNASVWWMISVVNGSTIVEVPCPIIPFVA